MMNNKPRIDPKDIEIFESAVKGARRLHVNKIPPSPPAIKIKQHKTPLKNDETSFELNELIDLPNINAETNISYHQSGVAHKTLRNLRKGQYNNEAVLDLHGMTIAEAKTATHKFLHECIAGNLRVVLIIHGKGRGQQPILKNKLNHWLRGVPAVLAFCSASSAHGSRGALYILLKAVHR